MRYVLVVLVLERGRGEGRKEVAGAPGQEGAVPVLQLLLLVLEVALTVKKVKL